MTTGKAVKYIKISESNDIDTANKTRTNVGAGPFLPLANGVIGNINITEIIFSLTIIIFISDFKYYIINDGPLFISILFILGLRFYFFGSKVLIHSVLSGLFMFVLFLLIKFFGDRIFKKESLGGGDIKLAILLGVILDIRLGLAAFILSAFIAFPYALFVSIFKKEAIVPYGPFIISAHIPLIFSRPQRTKTLLTTCVSKFTDSDFFCISSLA